LCIFIFQDYRRFIGKTILSIHFNVRFYNQNKKVPEIRGLFEVILDEGIDLLVGQGVAVFNGADVADEGVPVYYHDSFYQSDLHEFKN